MNHGNRFEDIGMGRILKYWPVLICIFTAGGWYQSSSALSRLTEKHQVKIEEHDERITKVEDAVNYLAQIVKDDRRRRQ